MADESTETEETTEVEETEDSTEESTSEESEQEEATEKTVKSGDDWEAKARKRSITITTEREARKAAEAKVKEFEDANKSDSEKLTDKATTAEKEAAEAKAEAAKLRVAIKYDLSEEDLDFLGSGDEEEIEERAERLSKRLSPQKGDEETEEEKPEVKRRPVEKTKRTGATSRREPEEMDPDKLAEAVPSQGF
jgi:hypothetical protein